MHLCLLKKHSHTQAEDERDYRDWLKKNEGNKELSGLTSFWSNPRLEKSEQFLRDYILKQGHRDKAELNVPTYAELVGVDSDDNVGVARSIASDSEDEEALEEQEDFERHFNFRFEEPESNLVSINCLQTL